MANTKNSAKPVAGMHLSWRKIINLAVILLLLYAVLPRLGKFKSSFEAVRHGEIGWVLVALGFAVATSFIAAGVLTLLAKKRLLYRRTLIVQFASLFANRLLPSGVGSIGVNFEYLRRNRHSKITAGAVVATVTLIGFVGHLLLLSFVLPATHTSLIDNFHLQVASFWFWLVPLIIIGILISLLWFKKLRYDIARVATGTFRNLASYRTEPLKLVLALLLSIGLTSCYALCLLASAYSVGVHLSFAQILVVLTVGVAASTITPTPGGLIGVEAGLFAGLVTFGVSSAEALAIVLVYRLLTYWLPLVFGAVAWEFVIHHNYI